MRPVITASFALFTALVCAGNCAATSAKANGAHEFTGMADYYHHSLYGKKTASGQVLAKHLYTAAHRTLPFGTHVHVKNHSNGRSCIVVINDRGPFTKSKVIDLSHSAATQLDMISAGTCKVGCTVVPKPKEVAGVAKVEVAVKPAVAVKSEIATKPAVAAKTEVAAKPAVVSKTDAVVKTEIAVKSEPSKADPEQKVELRQALAMKPAKAKQTTVNTDQARVDEARADETSAELEGAIPIKWTEVQ